MPASVPISSDQLRPICSRLHALLCFFSLFMPCLCCRDSCSANEAHGSAAHHPPCPSSPSAHHPLCPSSPLLIPWCPSPSVHPFFWTRRAHSLAIVPSTHNLLSSLCCFLSFRWRRQIAKSNPSPACQVLLFPCSGHCSPLHSPLDLPPGDKSKQRAFFTPFPLFWRWAQGFVDVVLPMRSSARSSGRKGMLS